MNELPVNNVGFVTLLCGFLESILAKIDLVKVSYEYSLSASAVASSSSLLYVVPLSGKTS